MFGIGKKNEGRRAGASAGDEPAFDANARVTPDELPPPSIEGERGIPAVNQRSYQSRGQMIAMVGGIAVLLALMWTINRSPDTPTVAVNDPMASKNQRFDEGRASGGDIAPPIPKAPPSSANPFEPPKPPTPLIGPIEVVPKIDGSRGPAGQAGGQQAKPLTPLEKRMRSKTTIQGELSGAAAVGSDAYGQQGLPAQGFPQQAIPGLPGLARDGGVMPVQAIGAQPRGGAMPGFGEGFAGQGPGPGSVGGERAGSGQTPGQQQADEGGISNILRPTRLQGAAAGKFPDRRLMMAQGKMIDCVLDTAISTVVAGMVRCSLTRDVYGEDGKVVLLDRGTEMTGEYRSNLRPGQSRLGIVWNRAKTPRGAVIELASPASDTLGRAGVDGYVDTHFWERYGAAILLSVLDDTLTIFANKQRDAGTVFIPPNTSGTGREAAGVALEQNIRIPPTIIKNQGEAITIFVARDLDFRTVYTYRGSGTL